MSSRRDFLAAVWAGTPLPLKDARTNVPGSPTLAERRKRLPRYRASNRRPIDREFVRSIFTRDHPGTSDLTVIEAFADAELARDTLVPTGTYVDMSANLPVLDPEKIAVPTLIIRG